MKRAIVCFAISALWATNAAAQKHWVDFWSDDPFLTGGTKSVSILPLGKQVLRLPPRDFPKVVEIPIDLQKYPNGITSFKILAEKRTYLLKKKFAIVIWPNLMRIDQDLTRGVVRITSLQGFSRTDLENPFGGSNGLLDYINARPEKIYLRNGAFLWKKELPCPGDCSFILGAKPATVAKP